MPTRARLTFTSLIAFALTLPLLFSGRAAAQESERTLIQSTLKQLNDLPSIKGNESSKSYKVLFDAYLELSKPPMPIGPGFNLNTIHAKMKDWKAVSGWAESNPKMAAAILACKDTKFTKVGLPYGRDGLDPKYVKGGVTADVGVNGSLRDNQFPYLTAMDTIAAFATAEMYRLMEANQSKKALDLNVAMSAVVRQFCDREFLAEKLHFVGMLSSVMSNMRDVFWVYQDRITADEYAQVAQKELPFLRPDRGRLFMPEADRVVSEALIREVFDANSGQPNPAQFTITFAEVQSKNAPLTRFGAAKRWGMIASVHSSLEDSLKRLNLVYDDWWRRWRIDQYDEQLLAVSSQFDRTNPIRYAAVIYSLQNLSSVFAVRNTLVAEVNGTAVAAGLCGYKKTYGTYPDDKEKIYTQYMRRASDTDPYDKALNAFKYQLLKSRQRVAFAGQSVWIEATSADPQALMYSQGQDHDDDRASTHSDDGVEGDIVLWPPIKALAREQGELD